MKKIFAVLAAALIVAIGAGTSGCASEDTIEEIQTEAPADSVGGMVISADEDEKKKSGITFTKKAIPLSDYEENGISAQAESAYTVTATTVPDYYASQVVILWELAWVDSTAEWAVDKVITDYVTVTSGEGVVESKTATVACLQAFGTAITLTAKCVYNGELDDSITASLQIDYSHRYGFTSCYFGGSLSKCSFSGEDRDGRDHDLYWGLSIRSVENSNGSGACGFSFTSRPITTVGTVNPGNAQYRFMKVVQEESAFTPVEGYTFYPDIDELYGKNFAWDISLFEHYYYTDSSGQKQSYASLYQSDPTTWYPTYAKGKCYLTVKLVIECTNVVITKKIHFMANEIYS